MKMMISRTQVFTVNPETQIKTNKQRQTHCWSSITDFHGIFGSSTGDRTSTHDVPAAGNNCGAESQFWEAVAFISMLTQRFGLFSVYVYVFGHTLMSWHQRGDEEKILSRVLVFSPLTFQHSCPYPTLVYLHVKMALTAFLSFHSWKQTTEKMLVCCRQLTGCKRSNVYRPFQLLRTQTQSFVWSQTERIHKWKTNTWSGSVGAHTDRNQTHPDCSTVGVNFFYFSYEQMFDQSCWSCLKKRQNQIKVSYLI